MKTKTVFGLVSLLLVALSEAAWARGGGGGFGGGGGHFGGGGGFGGGRPGGGAFHSSARGFSGGRPAYFYSRGMGFARPGNAPVRSPIQQSHASARTTRIVRGITNSAAHSGQRALLHASNPTTRPANPRQRPTLNGRPNPISEHHNAANWHLFRDRRHSQS